MAYFRAISFNCMAAILASQLFAFPATAGSITVGTIGQIVVGSNSQNAHSRNKIRIHRHYYSPKVHTPKVYHPNPVPKNAPYVQQKLKRNPIATFMRHGTGQSVNTITASHLDTVTDGW